MYNKRNIVIVGTLLLVLFGVAVWLIGRKIDETANRMHGTLSEEIGRYRAGLIALDFKRTVGLAESIIEYVEGNVFGEAEFQNLLKGFVKMDPKLMRIWYKEKDKNFVCIDSSGKVAGDAVLYTTWEKIGREARQHLESSFYYGDGVLFLTFYARSRDIVLGLDISLIALHDYFAMMSPAVRSYAYVLDERGILVAHPDEKMIGREIGEEGRKQLAEALRSEGLLRVNAYSAYLMLPVEREYYPIMVGNKKWMVVVNVPKLINEEVMEEFHQYTGFIVILTVLFFSILLAFSQYKWRKEYDRRKQLEQETLQLNLQQLKNQINPHFLFNALNSLNALISAQPEMAREFVLKLSKIYRYVLDKRQDSLVPVREEVELIRHYYFLQKIRFDGLLRVEIAEGVEQEERMIPLMSLQLLLENAIKHNEISKQYPLDIAIYTDQDILVVENTYHPRMDASRDSMGMGLENISKIYTFCTEKQFTFSIKNGRFICHLPLI